MTDYGADQARTIRVLAQSLAEMDQLRETSALREVLLDLSYALANLAGPIGALTDAWVEQSIDGTSPDGDLPDTDALVTVAANLRQLADNT
ncbi:hypothetical protein ACF07T_32885 [Streptomyces sp. NPDC015184]|uniref:hypothetical protein n=1 Tax=Streptomyces sp. NPDC015184 TaxID=3364946 RepID=UPI0036F61616